MASNENKRLNMVDDPKVDQTARRAATRRLPPFIGFGNGEFHCEDCGAHAEELAALVHAKDCPHCL